MTNLTGAQIIVPNATGVSGAPKISNDAIDVAMATLSSYVFAYIRAKRWTSPANSGLVDRTGNPITTQHTGETYNASDAAFGLLPSINIAGCSDTPYVIANRGAAPPTSFTFLAALEITTTQSSSKGHGLISQTTGGGGTTPGFSAVAKYLGNGTGLLYSGGATLVDTPTSGFPVINTPSIFVVSWDNTTSTIRWGLNGLPTNSFTAAGVTLAPSSTDFFRLFGYTQDNGYNMLGKFETAAIFNAAAGAGYAIDTLLAAAITSLRAVYGF